MTPNPVPHLCGGIFFDLLLEARKPRQKSRDKLKGGSDGLTVPGLYAGLIEVVTGEDLSASAGSTLRKSATNFKKCESSSGDYVPFTDGPVRSAFRALYKRKDPCLYDRMARFIDKYLNKDKCIWLIQALIETMQNDASVDGNTEIAVSYDETKTVKELHTASKIVLLPFLLCVLAYVMENCPDCESGADTFLTWYSQAGPNTEWKFTSDIGSNIPSIEVITDLSVPQLASSEKGAQDSESEELSDHDVIVESLSNTLKIFADRLGAVEHQLAEQIRQNKKEQAPPEEEPAVEVVEAEIVDDPLPDSEKLNTTTIIHNQTNIEHEESNTFNIDNSNVTFHL